MGAYSPQMIAELNERARQIRRDTVEVLATSTGGHYGGAFSAAELLSALIFHHLKIDPKNPEAPDRDRFILAKGHVSVAYCSALARQACSERNALSLEATAVGPTALTPTVIPGEGIVTIPRASIWTAPSLAFRGRLLAHSANSARMRASTGPAFREPGAHG